MKLIKRREHGSSVSYWLTFPHFSFPCDKDGNVNIAKLQPAGLANYNRCIQSSEGVVEESISRWTTPAVGECNHCERQVELSGFTNTCECGLDYNMSGNLLADRSQWGEDTYEHISDILSIA